MILCITSSAPADMSRPGAALLAAGGVFLGFKASVSADVLRMNDMHVQWSSSGHGLAEEGGQWLWCTDLLLAADFSMASFETLSITKSTEFVTATDIDLLAHQPAAFVAHVSGRQALRSPLPCPYLPPSSGPTGRSPIFCPTASLLGLLASPAQSSSVPDPIISIASRKERGEL